MSELIQTNDSRATIRWKLLTSASALALTLSSIGAAKAEDADRPPIWIELSGQLEGMTGSPETFSPSFMASITQPNLLSALDVQKPAAFAIGDEGKISFQPDSSDWVFSASIQYGRSGANRHHHQQTANKLVPVHFTVPILGGKYEGKYYYPSRHVKFADGLASQSEKHMVLDFQAGKDVGLGMFGGKGSSVLSAGVRIAQFTSKSNVTLRAEPDLQYPTTPVTSVTQWEAFRATQHIHFHDYAATASEQNSFRGVGPSLAWNASVPFAGNAQSTELTFDWGLNAAMLFGRQKASGHHRTTAKAYYLKTWNRGFYHYQKNGKTVDEGNFGNPPFQTTGLNVLPTSQHTNSLPHNRSRNVTVPDLGGFAGISARYLNAKISFGYKADFFFNAIDGGIDTRKEENRGFFGPYASISIGVGD